MTYTTEKAGPRELRSFGKRRGLQPVGRAAMGAIAMTVAAATAGVSTPVRAETRTWVATTPSSWHTASNWQTVPMPGGTPTSGVPQSGDGVVIGTNGASVTYNAPANAGALYSMLDVDSPGATAATLAMTASQLHTDRLSAGINGKGTVNVSGGSLNVFGTAGLALGIAPGSVGSFTLSNNAALTVALQALIGDAGTGAYTQTGGTFSVEALGALPGEIYVTSTPGASGSMNVSGGTVAADAVYVAPFGGNGTITHAGGSVTVRPGSLNALSVGDPDFAPGGNGQAVYDHAGGAVSTPALRIGAAGRFRQRGGTLKTNALVIDAAGGGRLDVDQNLVVDYLAAAGSPASTVRGYLKSGRNGGAWNGGGIMSTLANTTPRRAVGYGEASAVLNLTGSATTTWNGQTVDATTLLIRHTLSGDATLDGTVNFDDLLKLAQNYNTTGGRVWTTGDFTYDDNVDFDDLLALAQNYNLALPAEAIPGAPAGFEADLAAAFASVPEPGSAATILALAACGLVGRRRRRRG